jgi:hypothetical protein
VRRRMGFLSLIGGVVLGGCALLTPVFSESGDFTHVEVDTISANLGVVVTYELAGGRGDASVVPPCMRHDERATESGKANRKTT